MHSTRMCVAATAVLICIFSAPAMAQDIISSDAQTSTVVSIRPEYVPPSEILNILGVRSAAGLALMRWQDHDGTHTVDIRHNDAANLIIISGGAGDVGFAESLVREADIPPRQIEIEVQIIEINRSKARDVGIDWEQLVARSGTRFTWVYDEMRLDTHDEARDPISENIRDSERDQIRRDFDARSSVALSEVLTVLDQAGAASIRSAPKILTLNNRPATILDGQRVTYVTRYSSYTNLFETDSMDAGLTLSVLPSLGESGYITMQINAEMTTLGGTISGSPIKTGQLVENTIIVRDGESVLLGGLTRTIENRIHKRFPLLGYILPFIFSREVTMREEIESFMVLTPRVVDFATALDEETRKAIESE